MLLGIIFYQMSADYSVHSPGVSLISEIELQEYGENMASIFCCIASL